MMKNNTDETMMKNERSTNERSTKAATCLILATVLLIAVPAVAAGDSGQAEPLSPELEKLAAIGKIFPNWDAALFATTLNIEQPILFIPMRYSKGVAFYRLEGLDHGGVDYARVNVPTDPTLAPEPQEEVLTKSRCHPQSPRCDVPFTTGLGHNERCLVRLFHNPNFVDRLINTDHDWNTFSAYGINDRAGSIQTTCHGAFFFEHRNFGGTMLYIGPNTNQASLGSMTNKISSMIHLIP